MWQPVYGPEQTGSVNLNRGLEVHLVKTTLNQFTVLSKLVQLVSRGLGVHLLTTTINQFLVLSKLVQLISRGLHGSACILCQPLSTSFLVLSKLFQLVSRGLRVHLVTTTINQCLVLSKLVQLISRGLHGSACILCQPL